MRALVTGATGFVGSAVVRALCAEGTSVRAFVRPGADLRALAGLPVELVVGDVRRYDSVWRAVRGCDVIYHVAAAYRLWGMSLDELTSVAAGGADNVLRAAADHGGVERIVLTSTAGTVGALLRDEPNVLDESAPWRGAREPYVVAKRRAEERAIEQARALGLPLVVVNPSAVFGPGDWKPTPSGAAIAQFLNHGVPAAGPGGLNVVDVDDVARGHLLAAARGRLLECYILGGDDVTYEEFFDLLAELSGLSGPLLTVPVALALLYAAGAEVAAAWTGRPPLVTVRSVREFGGRYQYYSSARAERELGYTHRPAREALLRSVAYYVQKGYVRARRRERLRWDVRLARA